MRASAARAVATRLRHVSGLAGRALAADAAAATHLNSKGFTTVAAVSAAPHLPATRIVDRKHRMGFAMEPQQPALLLVRRFKHGSLGKKGKKAGKTSRAELYNARPAAAAESIPLDDESSVSDAEPEESEEEEPADQDYATVDDCAPLDALSARLDRVLEGLKKDLAVLRGGRVDPAMFDHLTVHSYGQEGPLSSVAQVSAKGPQLLVLTCYDPATAPAVVVAVRDSGMNLNPQLDGNKGGAQRREACTPVLVPIPKMSHETRESLVKVANKATEKAKVHMRGIRHKVLERLKKHKANFSEDDVHRRHKEIDTKIAAMEAKCAAALDAKKKDILSA
ncbi:ribosome recycling factor domain-containing protein [Tribonema minus]|uniref:Ribosome recycling factor domain-containing protein n=1 Tax=Tribonema minus TaxID=303371 RepID=A0A836CM55_9STRA|nr:ribosome recycling factor domain-containing protein [Tribonema minus]